MTVRKPAKNRPETPSSRQGGRPTKHDALVRAIQAAGVDPALVDPKRVLAGIAIDKAAPASARVAAAKALLLSSPPRVPEHPGEQREEGDADAITRRALEVLARGGRATGRPN